MYINIAGDYSLKTSEIIGVFDIDKLTVYRSNRNYLSKMEKRGKIVNTTEKLPKSFIVLDGKEDKVYLSQFLPSTLLKRRYTKQRSESR